MKSIHHAKTMGALVLAVLGAYATVTNFLPRLEVATGQRTEGGDLFAVPYVVRNPNLLPLFRVSFSCHVLEAIDSDRNRYDNLEYVSVAQQSSMLRPFDQETVYCKQGFRFAPLPTLDSAVVSVVAHFRSVLWWPEHRKRYCFTFSRVVGGGEQWLPSARACPPAA